MGAGIAPLGCSPDPEPAGPTAEQQAVAELTRQQAALAAQLYQQAKAAGVYDEPAKTASAPEPATPAEAPKAAEPDPVPPAGPSPADQPAPVAPPDPDKLFLLSTDRLDMIDIGMSYDTIQALLESPGETISSGAKDVVLLKWTDPQGTSFVGRFEDGKLVQKSTLQPGVPDDEAHTPLHLLTQSDYNAIQPGMSVREAMARLSFPAKSVSGGSTDVQMFKWEDDLGSSFIARFEDGKLVRKTGFTVVPAGEPDAEGMAEEGSEEGAATETEEGPVENEVRAPREPGASTPEAAPEADRAPQERRVFRTTPPERRVYVAGESRRDRQESRQDPNKPAGSYAPKAALPDFTWSLRRGAYEIRINNPSNSRVEVGLRNGKGGRDAIVSAGGSHSFQVDRGTYQIYYIYSDDPYTRYGGQSLVLDGYRLTDVDITLFDEAIDVQHLVDGDAYRF
ncbi:MAG: hypothetical protein IT368_18050 [Candidatus Hydrogenedentes bacterium]|nr:hypothetical protein [Candidatus Hydrogenedentota bacterium]